MKQFPISRRDKPTQNIIILLFTETMYGFPVILFGNKSISIDFTKSNNGKTFQNIVNGNGKKINMRI